MSQQSLTQFFKSKSNKQKLQGPDGDHKTFVTKKNAKKSKRNFPGWTQEVFFQTRASTWICRAS